MSAFRKCAECGDLMDGVHAYACDYASRICWRCWHDSVDAGEDADAVVAEWADAAWEPTDEVAS